MTLLNLSFNVAIVCSSYIVSALAVTPTWIFQGIVWYWPKQNQERRAKPKRDGQWVPESIKMLKYRHHIENTYFCEL